MKMFLLMIINYIDIVSIQQCIWKMSSHKKRKTTVKKAMYMGLNKHEFLLLLLCFLMNISSKNHYNWVSFDLKNINNNSHQSFGWTSELLIVLKSYDQPSYGFLSYRIYNAPLNKYFYTSELKTCVKREQ